MQQPSSDADRSRQARVFRNIDTWFEQPDFDFTSAMTNNHTRDSTFVGLDVSREFLHILFEVGDDDIDQKLPQQTDCSIALLACRFKASDLYHQFRFMIDHLEVARGSEPVRSFIQAIKEDVNTNRHGQISPAEEVYSLNTISFIIISLFLLVQVCLGHTLECSRFPS